MKVLGFSVWVLLAVFLEARRGWAQAPGVEIVRDKAELVPALTAKANALLEEQDLLTLATVSNQLTRASCDIELPKLKRRKLSSQTLWSQCRAAHLRIGWHYRCKNCDKWHLNLAGGYFINESGAVATCYHVLAKMNTYREGYLVAANGDGEVFAVTEVLAADKRADVAIVKIEVASKVSPLPLKEDTFPGDEVWCYSDPLGRSGYFSHGIINRFYFDKQDDSSYSPRIQVSTDWAPGSSGAAVVDQCGNAIGHVSKISSVGIRNRKRSEGDDGGKKIARQKSGAVIVFHCAARAKDVLSLVRDD